MNTKEHAEMKIRGSADVSYLGRTVDEMIWEFMEENGIPGLTLAIVQAPYIPRVVGYGLSDEKQRRLASVNTMWPAGPISQAYAAVAAMQLYEAGKLDLDAPVSQYVEICPRGGRGSRPASSCTMQPVWRITGRRRATIRRESGALPVWRPWWGRRS